MRRDQFHIKYKLETSKFTEIEVGHRLLSDRGYSFAALLLILPALRCKLVTKHIGLDGGEHHTATELGSEHDMGQDTGVDHATWA
jgi:hypothetical protein